MNVLFIGLDPGLVGREGANAHDGLQREILISRQLEHYFVIILTLADRDRFNTVSIGNFTAYPTLSRSGFDMVPDAIRIGRKILKQNSIDLISAQDPLLTGLAGSFLKREGRVPLNIQIHGDYIDNSFWLKESLTHSALNLLGRVVLKQADSLLLVHRNLEERFKTLCAEKPVFRLADGLGINISLFNKDDARDKGRDIRRNLGLDQPFDRLVLFAGRLAKQKNITNLLKAVPRILAAHPDTLFVIAGEGPEKGRLAELSRRMSISRHVKFAGQLPYSEMPALFAAAHLFVLPSNYEGYSRVLMEALAAAIPVVTTSVTGASDIVKDGQNGFMVPVNNPAALAGAAIKILNNAGYFKNQAEQLRPAVINGRYDQRRITGDIIRAWQDTANIITT